MTAAGEPERGRSWSLTREAFDRLLALLDPDRQRAAERYETVRRKLVKLFEWRGCAAPEELVDVVFDRVARRLEEGALVPPADAYSYAHGVALRVLQEHWRSAARQPQALDHVTHLRTVFDGRRRDSSTEARLECLAECLGDLTPEDRRLLERYHHGENETRIRARREMAEALGISATALRIRAFRIRRGLEACIESCRARRGETEAGGHPLTSGRSTA